jgi:hypothetical protein
MLAAGQERLSAHAPPANARAPHVQAWQAATPPAHLRRWAATMQSGLNAKAKCGEAATEVAQTSKSADLSRLGSGERDCLREAKARPAGPCERARASQSRVSKPAAGSTSHALPIWKSAIRQVGKPALRCRRPALASRENLRRTRRGWEATLQNSSRRGRAPGRRDSVWSACVFSAALDCPC